MKNLIPFLFLVTNVLITSCNNNNNYNSTTKIFPDGSCSRELSSFMVDSAFMVGDTSKNPFPMKLDSSWKISWTYSPKSGIRIYSNNWPLKQWNWDKDTSKRLTLSLIAKKQYPNVEEMAKTFRYDHSDWNTIIPKISFEKKFRFFFTFYTYKEVYPKYNPLKLVPVEKYLTTDEIKMLYADNPKFAPELNGAEIKEILDGIDKKKEEWLNRSLFEEMYRTIPKYLRFLKNSGIDSSRLMLAKDSVYTLMTEKGLKDDLSKALNKHFKTTEFTKLDTLKGNKKEDDRVLDLVIKPFSTHLSYHLLMPGKILQTSSKQSHGDTLTWNVEPYRFFFSDYELMAESKVANTWAFVVSAIFLIIVAVSFFIKRK